MVVLICRVFRRGVEWIMATNSWMDVLGYCLAQNSTVYVVKESYNFMYSLLESKVHYDEAFCNVVVKRIMQPLMVSDFFAENFIAVLCVYLNKKVEMKVVLPADSVDLLSNLNG